MLVDLSLPLNICDDLRDHWYSSKAPIQTSVDNLAKKLGYRLVPRVDWPFLYNSLKDRFPVESAFIPAISQLVTTFYSRLLSRLENEANSEWTEEFLNGLAKSTPGSTYPLRIEASANAGPRPLISWKAELGFFYLEVPNSDPVLKATVETGFDQDLDNLFPGSGYLNGRKSQSLKYEATATQLIRPWLYDQRTERLPGMDVLPRPVELFKNTTPHILIVDAHAQPFTIQSSHQQSLDLLASYLTKWGKTNPNDGLERHYLKVTRIESLFCEGVIDAVSIEPYSTYRMDRETLDQRLNPTLVLAFIEGILGYKLVHTTGVRWVYKSGTVLVEQCLPP